MQYETTTLYVFMVHNACNKMQGNSHIDTIECRLISYFYEVLRSDESEKNLWIKKLYFLECIWLILASTKSIIMSTVSVLVFK